MAKTIAKQTTVLNESLLKVADLLTQAAFELRRIAQAARHDRSQAWFWTKEWQEAEKQADEDIRKGRITRLSSTDELDKPYHKLFPNQ